MVYAVYGVRLTVRNMGKYLQRWGFTPQRPLKKANEQSPEAVQEWVNKEYPKIADAAKQEGAEIQWSDETGFVPTICADVVTRRREKLRSYSPMPIASN